MTIGAIHHVGYVVEDLRAGVARFAAATGAGPFFAMEHIVFDEVTYRGEPAAYDHSSAFGAWGGLLVELTQVHDARPAGLRDSLVKAGGGVGHIAWLVDALDDEIDRLGALGVEVFHTGRTGPVSAAWFDGRGLVGHPIEVLEAAPPLLGFYDHVRAAADGWGGADPFRIQQAPPR